MDRPPNSNPDSYESAWKLLKYIGCPIGIPFIFYQFFSYIRTPRVSLQDKVVLITGASSGIGEETAHKFYKQGCKVILLSRRVEELNRVKNDLLNSKKHPNIVTHEPLVMQLDLNDLESFPDCIKKILDIHGQIDVLINNAGVGFRGSAINTNMEVDKKVMHINYFAQVALTKAVLPHMIQRKTGHIVYMNSIQGKIGLPRRSAYAASKHALQGFCDSLRPEVQRYNIKISNICPSYVVTPLSFNALTENGETNKKNELIRGLSSETVAEELLNAVISNKNEILLGPFFHKVFAIYRNVLLTAYFRILSKFEDDYVKKESTNQ